MRVEILPTGDVAPGEALGTMIEAHLRFVCDCGDETPSRSVACNVNAFCRNATDGADVLCEECQTMRNR